MTLKDKRIAILVDQQYQEMEIWYPLYRFRETGAKVVTLGAVAGAVYPSKVGYPCTVSYTHLDVYKRQLPYRWGTPRHGVPRSA